MDEFDELVNLESQFAASGINEGRIIGLQRGYEDGFELGRSKGETMGKEIGFYSACVHTWLALVHTYPTAFSPRCVESIRRLAALVQTFPLSDPHYSALAAKLQLMRAKFTAILAMMHCSSSIRTDTSSSTLLSF